MKLLSTASNGISMNPWAVGPEEQTAPLLERRTRFTQPPLALAHVLLVLHRERGGYFNLGLFTLTFSRSS